MKKKILLYGLILTMIITLLSGCSSSGRKDIIGKWTVTNIETKSSNNFLESLQYSLLKMLFSPGTVMEFYDTKVSVAMNSMDYKWIKENTIQIGNDKGEDAPIIFDVEIDKESMTLSNSMVSIYLVKGESDHIGEDKASLDNNQDSNNSDGGSRAVEEELDKLRREYDALLAEKDVLLAEKDVLLAEKDALLAEKDSLLLEKDTLLAEKDSLLQELEKYKKIVDAREFITVDHEIDEKFASSYGLDEKPLVHGVAFSVTEVGEGQEFEGKSVEEGSLVFVKFDFENQGIEDVSLAHFTMELVERDGSKYKAHFQSKDRFQYDIDVLTHRDRLSFIYENAYKNQMAPKFSDDGVVVFHVAELSDEYLLQIHNINSKDEVAYIRIK